MPTMRSTIKDLAKALGVNVGTVSRALNDKPGVSPELRRRIVRKAKELNYRPSGHARGLVTQRTETIGLLSGEETSVFLSNPFYAGVFAGIETETRLHNYALMFASVAGENRAAHGGLPKFIAERRADGVLVVGAVELSMINLLRSSGFPFVVVDYHLPEGGLETVVTDNVGGGRTATEHLLQQGHRHIAFVGGGPLDHGNFFERLQGYREALAAAGIRYRPELVQGGGIVDGFNSTLRILDRAPEVTAIVGCNDANAMAAMAALRTRNLEVPGRVSVIGFDDIPEATDSWPPLTTMRVDRFAMGRKAAERLIQMLAENASPASHESVFSAKLIIRGSTAAPPT
jgi:LacI family transcriptional regulator